MRTLKHILSELNIETHDQLQEYIEENYHNQESSQLKIIKKSDLQLYKENRIIDEVVEYNNTIFDIDELVLKDSKTISFINCIFTGNLSIRLYEKDNITIYFDYVGIKGTVSIIGCKKINSINFAELNTPALHIRSTETKLLHLSGSNIIDFSCISSSIEKFEVWRNLFNYLEISNNIIKNVDFSNGQLVFSTFIKTFKDKNKKVLQENFLYLKFNNNEVYDIKIEKLKSINDTCSFLLEQSDYYINKQELAQIKYLEGLSAIKNNTLNTWAYQLFGGLIKPGRIILLIFLTIFIFSIIFYFFPFTFDDECERNFPNAVYFSGITFATIGYGDISPTGMGRFLAILEGIIGILLSSSFIISLVRRYID